MKTHLLLLLLLGYPQVCKPQSGKASLLLNQLKTAQSDTARAKIYYALSRFYWDKDPDSALVMGQKSLSVSINAHYELGMALAYLTMGVAYGTKAMYPEALDCDLKALRLSEKLGLDGLTGNNYTNIAIIYSNMQDYPKALDYFRRALTIARTFPNQNGIATALINIGDIYTREMNLDSALLYTFDALHIAERIHDSSSLSNALLNLGDIYSKKEEPLTALTYFKRSLPISEDMNDGDGVSYTHNSMADAYRLLGRYKSSIFYAKAGLREAEVLHTNETIKNAYRILYADYLALKDFERALDYKTREITLNDSIYSLGKEKQIKALQSDYELAKKQHQVDLQQAELARNKIKYYALIGGGILLLIWIFFLVRGNGQKRSTNRLLQARNNEILRQNKQLEDLNMVKNKILSIIGHDLRSPIVSLCGFVDLLTDAELSMDQIHKFSSQIGGSLQETIQLLDNLLFWAKTQMEGLQENARVFDLLPLLEQNKRLALNRANGKNITLLTEHTPSPAMVYADEVMVDIVIRNLVDNAIKFSHEGGKVCMSLALTPGGVSTTIRDLGQGIPAADQEKIFKSISYTTDGTAHEKGSGLGLSLCKELIDRNNGKIWFESEPGKGTSFTFVLPGRVTAGPVAG